MIEQLPFGRTGHDSTRAIFGAAALMYDHTTRADADRALELVRRFGVNHIDVAAGYGEAEVWIAPWLAEHRDDFFLATKTGERERGPAHDQIRRSLERMGVDHIDLLQLHNLVDVIEWEAALGTGGALEAAIEAREEGLVRFIGVTGHGLSAARMHRRSLERFSFDSVLLPYSAIQIRDDAYAADFEELVAVCEQRGVAIQTIKAICLAPWNGRAPTSSTWYEPLREQADIDLAVHWVLGRTGTFLNTVGDLALLPMVLDAAARFEARPPDDAIDDLVSRRSLVALF